MQCTSYFPVYYHARDLNIGASGFSSHLLNSNADCGEERGYTISLPLCTMDEYSVYEKEVLGQIIQNHEATFRYQVRELHRLYRRQRELVDEIRVREIFTQHCSSQTQPDISQTTSHAMSWLLGDHSHHNLSALTVEKIQQPPAFVAKHIPEPAKSFPGPLISKSGYHEIESISSRSKGTEKRIFDLELPADVYHDDDARDSSRYYSNSVKRNVLIDLNEPVQFETCHMEIMHNGRSLSGLYTGPGGINSSVAIDLNYSPVGCFSETWLDEKFLKIESQIDLNTGVIIDGPSPPTIDLEGPVSPENKECSPPRGKCEDIQIETPPLLSEQGEEEPYMELDKIAAQTLVLISSSEKSLFWFAEIVSSMGDDIENEIMKRENLATDHGQNERLPNGIDDLCEENGVNLSHVLRQEKETGTLSGKSRKGKKGIHKTEGFLKTGTLRRNACKKGCGKLRKKHPKLSTSDVVKKATDSVLKMPVLLSWGKIKRRRGGRRRKGSKNVFLFVS